MRFSSPVCFTLFRYTLSASTSLLPSSQLLTRQETPSSLQLRPDEQGQRRDRFAQWAAIMGSSNPSIPRSPHRRLQRSFRDRSLASPCQTDQGLSAGKYSLPPDAVLRTSHAALIPPTAFPLFLPPAQMGLGQLGALFAKSPHSNRPDVSLTRARGARPFLQRDDSSFLPPMLTTLTRSYLLRS